jgi:lipopolysaccharide/colanic/teichoic acid biosynthesis glycosyltransferase
LTLSSDISASTETAPAREVGAVPQLTSGFHGALHVGSSRSNGNGSHSTGGHGHGPDGSVHANGNGNGIMAAALPLTVVGPRVVNGNGHGYGNGNGYGASNGHGASNGNGTSSGHGTGNGNGAGRYHADPVSAAAALLMSAPGLDGVAVHRASPVGVAETWVGAAEEPARGLYLRFGKRFFDLLAAVVGLVFSAPVLLLFSILIKLDSRGPVLYKSVRLGKNGRPFIFYKLRSMYTGADRDREQLQHLNEVDGPVFKLSRDPRTTRVGRFIRQTSIDELPQFLNVLRGDMSLVGPRPPLPEEVDQYETWHRRRLEVKPGLTCLWQISGRSRLGFNEWMRLDLEYIKHQSFATDVKILWRTVPAVLSREGAY